MITVDALDAEGKPTLWAFSANESVTDEMLLLQLETSLQAEPPKAVNLGLMANQTQLGLLASWLEQHLMDIPRVVDLTMAESSDNQCTASRLDYSPLLTPHTVLVLDRHNVEVLSGQRIDSAAALFSAATELQSHLDCHLIIKGGNLSPNEQNAGDILWLNQPRFCSEEYFARPFLLQPRGTTTKINRGSHHAFSTAIAEFLAQDWTTPDAVILAEAYVSAAPDNTSLTELRSIKEGMTDFPQQLSHFPRVLPLDEHGQESASTIRPFVKLDIPLDIYPVVDNLEMIEQLLKAGCQTLQLRVKTAHPENIAGIIEQAIALGKQYHAQLFINDHWQLALQYGAFGVHLGQEDLQTADLKAINDAGLALGISSHSYFEALIAMEQQPSYLALGHIFPTTTKTMPSLPQGLYRLTRYAATFASVLPTVAIGGIDQTNLAAILASGIGSAAVVRAVTLMPDPGKAFCELREQWQSLAKARCDDYAA